MLTCALWHKLKNPLIKILLKIVPDKYYLDKFP